MLDCGILALGGQIYLILKKQTVSTISKINYFYYPQPSPVFDSSLKLYRSIARQYAYFYNKIHSLDIPVLKKLQEIFTYNNYR